MDDHVFLAEPYSIKLINFSLIDPLRRSGIKHANKINLISLYSANIFIKTTIFYVLKPESYSISHLCIEFGNGFVYSYAKLAVRML